MSEHSNIWRRRLKYVATVNDDVLHEDVDDDYLLQYVDIGNVNSSGSIQELATHTFKDAPSRARRRVRDGDIIVSCVRTYLQAIALIKNPPANLVVSTGFAVVRPSQALLNPNFAIFALRDPLFLTEIEKRSVGVSYPAINASDLVDISISLPSLSEQHAISAYLNGETTRLEALIGEKQRVLGLLHEKRRALITRAITRGLHPNVPFRESGVSWLGEIPAQWEVRKIAWLFRQRDHRGEPNLRLLEVSLKSGVVARQFSDERIESTAADFNTYKVARRGDVVFNKMRMWQGAVGVAPQDGLVSPDYVVAEPVGPLTSGYANMLFQTPSFSAECARHSHGIVWDRLRLYWAGFRDIEVPLPPVKEQVEIVEQIGFETNRLDELSEAIERTIVLLKERRAALIAAAVTGQIDVGSET